MLKLSEQKIFEDLVDSITSQQLSIKAAERPDVFPVDDLGIQKAMCRLYNLRPTKTLKVRMLRIAKNWIPNRTLACRYLWKSLDNT